MERELPTYIIKGRRFAVDVLKEELRQKDLPENIIRFADMDYTGSGYQFSFDLVTGNLGLAFSHNPIDRS
jgi:hypothetical protein